MKTTDGTDESAAALDSMLRRGLQTDPLSAEALQRIRSATEAQWRETVAAAGPARGWRRFAVAASVALLTLTIGWVAATLGPNGPASADFGRLERADYPGAIERHGWSRDRALIDGAMLVAGQKILVRGGARISLPGSGSLRLAAGTHIEISAAQLIRLVDGNMYVDIPPVPSRGVQLVVVTPAGSFTHLGTQFQIAVRDGQTQVRVREGQVRWQSGAEVVLADAGTQLLIDQQGHVTRDQVATTGAGWQWAEMLAPSFEIENRPLVEFLHYMARETGRKLVFPDPAVERRAATTILHGSIDKLTAVEALSAVMATTSLRFTLGQDSIQIESERDSAKKSR